MVKVHLDVSFAAVLAVGHYERRIEQWVVVLVETAHIHVLENDILLDWNGGRLNLTRWIISNELVQLDRNLIDFPLEIFQLLVDLSECFEHGVP